jgi:hypothetical protein
MDRSIWTSLLFPVVEVDELNKTLLIPIGELKNVPTAVTPKVGNFHVILVAVDNLCVSSFVGTPPMLRMIEEAWFLIGFLISGELYHRSPNDLAVEEQILQEFLRGWLGSLNNLWVRGRRWRGSRYWL